MAREDTEGESRAPETGLCLATEKGVELARRAARLCPSGSIHLREVADAMKTNPTISRRKVLLARETRARCLGPAVWLSISTLMLWGAVASAVEVVDVRVGHHTKYTRVVFELDDATGYQIERSENARGKELVVSLDARTQPANFVFDKGLVESMRVEQKGNRAIARLGLRRAGLGLKEMTLADPPRLVVDVLATTNTPTPSVARAAVSKPKTPAAPAAPKPAVKTATPPAPPAPKPAVKTAAPPAPPAPKPPVATATPTVKPVEKARKPARPTPEVPRARRGPKEKLAKSVVPLAPTPPDAESFPIGTLAWIAAGVGVFLLLGAGVAIKRRRAPAEVPEDVFPDLFAPREPQDNRADLPGTEEQGEEAEEHESGPALGQQRSLDPPVLPELDEWTLDSGDSMESVDEGHQASPTESDPESAAGFPYPDLSPVLQEIENRVAMLEGRIDSILAERDGVDKQMDAHTEELRVQRAAIARTQRAVRTLSRPEDAEIPAAKTFITDPESGSEPSNDE